MKIRNDIAAFGWIFSAVFLLMCLLFTYILIRDGTSNIQIYPSDIPEYYPPWVMPLVLAAFWLAGIGLGNYVASNPCIAIEVQQDKSVVVVNRYPFRRVVRHIKDRDLSPAHVIESTDSDGDPYFRVIVGGPDGFTVCLAEGHDRGRCASVCAEFNDAIGKTVAAASQG